jgi:hypothetical protein
VLDICIITLVALLPLSLACLLAWCFDSGTS